MRRVNIIIVAIAALLLAVVSGCTKNADVTLSGAASNTFRDIPGVTDGDIAAVEALLEQTDSFIYGVRLGSEAFTDENGGIRGFSALFADWLTGLFGVPFTPTFYSRSDLIDRLATGEIDFVGHLTATDERRKTYLMTDAIAQRNIKYIQMARSPSLTGIAATRPLRYGSLSGTTTFDLISPNIKEPYDLVFVDDFDVAYDMLKDGAFDAFIFEGQNEYVFDNYSDVSIHDFVPLIYVPVSLTTQNPALEPIISVVDKALDSGGVHYLTELYNKGYHEYLKSKLFVQLTEEELSYIQNNRVIRYAAERDNYPISFYNVHEKEWQGAAHDILREVESVTGLTFDIANSPDAGWSDMLGMLESGEAPLITELLRSDERIGRFLWPDYAIMEDRTAFISKIEYRNVTIRDIPNIRVGLVRNTAHAELFKQWFPGHMGLVDYNDTEDVIEALGRGEIDLMMSRTNHFLAMVNYYELLDYKINLAFNNTYQSLFGINKDEELLCSIINKALGIIDTEPISMNWAHMTYDYRYKLIEAQRPWLIGATAMSLLILVLITVMFFRKRAMEKALIGADLTQILMDSIPISSVLLDKDRKVITMNNEAVRYFELSGREDAIDLFTDRAPEYQPCGRSSVEMGLEDVAKAFRDGSHHFEWMHKNKSGELMPAEVDLVRVSYKGEYAVAGYTKDLSARKANHAEIEKRGNLLDAGSRMAAILLAAINEDDFEKTLLEGMSHIGVCLDVDRVQIWRNEMINGALCFVMRYEWLSELGRQKPAVPAGLSFPYSMKPDWEELFRRGETINAPLSALPKEDQEFLTQYEMKSIANIPLFIDNDFYGFFSIDDCRRERTFTKSEIDVMRSGGLMIANALLQNSMIKNIRSSSEAKSQFIANMSHEMRTPMNVVVGLTDLMLEEEDPVNTKENLKKINTAGNTLMGLINDVLDISKIEAGKLELMPEQYDVASNINDLVTLNLIRIEDKPVTFQLNINETLHSTMFGDDLRVKQILNNLLSNAFKYTHKGTVTLGIDSRREDEYLWVDFSISDTGIGIREEDMAKLFTDYNQVDTRANRRIEGTGLGLSITRQLVELMDGTISVESRYGKGTTFRVRIRQGFVSDAAIGRETADNLCGFRYSDTKKRTKLMRSDLSYARVLLVDDFPTNLDVAAGMLRKYKMQVDCVDNGRAAVDRIAAGKPAYDAVFMDHMMPEMDGVEATEQIRAIGSKYARTVPIIALTANAVAGNEQMFLDKGFNAYLSKPINVMTLDAIVQRWVRDKSKE